MVYDIDRSNLPPISFTDLTLNIYLGAINGATVTVDGASHPHTYDPATGYLTLTTTGSALTIVADGATNDDDLGFVHRGKLKDNRSWAWSHGFDDNFNLEPAIALFEEKDWTGSIYLIADLVDPTAVRNYAVDEIRGRELLNNGWSLGGHGSDSSCTDFNEPAVIESLTRIEDIVAGSNRPDYHVTGFAAPCFVSQYHPIVLDLRDRGVTDVRFNESGGDYIQIVDPGATTFFDGSRRADAFNIDARIGRDVRIEFAPFSQISADIDWISEQSESDDLHLWYNSLSHGNQEANVELLVDYIYDNYGPGGTDEVWVAPADQIYSYIITRDDTDVTLSSVSIAAPSECNGLDVTVNIALGQTPTSGDDVILGTEGDDIIDGLSGDDTICGLGGDDEIKGGGGNDTIFGDDGLDMILGSRGNDTIFGGEGPDVIGGQAGNDILEGNADDDRINGGPGNDIIDGGDGDDDLRGQGGSDTLMGQDGVDQFFGGSGEDTILTGTGGNAGTAQIVQGQSGPDTIFGSPQDDVLDGGLGQDEIHGDAGNDILNGGRSGDTLFGDAGDDIVNGGPDRDTLSGGDGEDTCNGGGAINDTADATCETAIQIP